MKKKRKAKEVNLNLTITPVNGKAVHDIVWVQTEYGKKELDENEHLPPHPYSDALWAINEAGGSATTWEIQQNMGSHSLPMYKVYKVLQELKRTGYVVDKKD